jgi:hypothetical protein
VNAIPATVIVPTRELVPVFAATEKATLPLPLPEAGLPTVIQLALLAAVHVQPAVAVTVTDPLEALEGSLAELEFNEYAQFETTDTLNGAVWVSPPPVAVIVRW